MWDGLIATKFAAPQPRGDLICRPRLVEQVERHDELSLVALVAPAGAGKSTLLADWYRTLSRRQVSVAWLSLDPDDDKLVRFLTYVFAALNQAHRQIGARAAALLRSVPILDTETLLPLLVNDLAALDSRLALFLDDLHVLSDPGILAFLDRLLTYAPRNFSLFVASRNEPPLPMARLQLRGQAMVVTQEDLRFDLAEAEQFLNRARQLGLSVADVQLLHGRTEGWAAGLRLASLALERRAERSSFLRSFTGTDRDVTDFLAQDVLLRQPQEVQHFLLRTAVLTRFDADLAQHMTGRPDTAAMIERLHTANLFLVPLDAERRWFRYHHLFADFLRARLEQIAPGETKALHRAAAAWHRARGAVGEALHHALAVGDHDWAAALVEDKAMHFFRQGQLTLVRDWLSRLPEAEIARRPRLRLIFAWIAFHMLGQRQGFRHLFEARRALRCAADAPAESQTPALLAEVRTLTAGVISSADHSSWSRALAERWLDELPVDQPFLRGTLANVLGFSCYTLGDLPAASRAAERGRAEHGRGHYVFGMVYSDLILGLVDKARGHLRAAESRLRRSAALAREAFGSPSYSEAMVAVFLAELAYERGEVAEAERLLQENHYIIDGTALIVHAVVGYQHLARLEVLAGRMDAALAILERAERMGRERLYRRLRAGVLNERVRLLLAQGDLASAQDALSRSRLVADPDQGPRVYAPQVELAQVALARVLIAERRYDRALRLLDSLAQSMETEDRGRRLIQVLCLKALALAKAGRPAAAQEALRRALARGEPEGFLRSIADEGKGLKPLLTALLARASAFEGSLPTAGYIQRVLTAIAQPRPARLQPALEAHLTEALSGRELDIVRLLSQGCSNEELAEALALAPSTIKWHLKNIFGKLGVRSRTQVVLAAQKLQLLS